MVPSMGTHGVIPLERVSRRSLHMVVALTPGPLTPGPLTPWYFLNGHT